MDGAAAPKAASNRPAPGGRWSVAMRWHELLFAHWPVRPESLRPWIPNPLEVGTFDGRAWIGIVPFRMTGVRLRHVPTRCGLAFPELNVRTYVRHGGKRGVWFFSLDAGSRLGVRVARAWYRLPYHHARIQMSSHAGRIRFVCRRLAHAAPAAALDVEYEPVGSVFQAEPGSLDDWLIERYCLFSARREQVGCGEIYHAPWPLRRARATFRVNTMLEQLGLPQPADPPRLHYAQELDVVAWSIRWR